VAHAAPPDEVLTVVTGEAGRQPHIRGAVGVPVSVERRVTYPLPQLPGAYRAIGSAADAAGLIAATTAAGEPLRLLLADARPGLDCPAPAGIECPSWL
jgi:hypothetical protein